MKNKDLWRPSKFVMTKGGCIGSRDTGEVCGGSRLMTDRVAQVYEEAIRKYARGVLLDLGCGKVPLYEVYRPHVTDNICVDWANTLHKSPYLDYEFDLNAGIPLESAQFDTILATDVLEHISNPNTFWAEMSRLLKPRGMVILGTPFLYGIHEQPYDYCRYTEYKLRAFCDAHNLRVVSLSAYGGPLEVVRDILAKQAASSNYLSQICFHILDLLVRCVFCLIKQHAKDSEKFPFGYCLIVQK